MKLNTPNPDPAIVGPCRDKPVSVHCATCILDSSDYFSGLGLEVKLALQQILQFGEFARRELLYGEGADSQHLYILLSGKVKVYEPSAFAV